MTAESSTTTALTVHYLECVLVSYTKHVYNTVCVFESAHLDAVALCLQQVISFNIGRF